MIHDAIDKFIDAVIMLIMFLLMTSISLPAETIERETVVFEKVEVPVIKVVDETIPWIHPLPGFKPGSGFGWRNRPFPGFHYGTDIAAPTGTSIQPAAHGTITRVQRKYSGYGFNVVVRHNKNTYTLYAHMSKITCKVGDYVEPGDVIGLVGSTGLSTCPHLHFEVIQNNVKVNPDKFIQWKED